MTLTKMTQEDMNKAQHTIDVAYPEAMRNASCGACYGWDSEMCKHRKKHAKTPEITVSEEAYEYVRTGFADTKEGLQ